MNETRFKAKWLDLLPAGGIVRYVREYQCGWYWLDHPDLRGAVSRAVAARPQMATGERPVWDECLDVSGNGLWMRAKSPVPWLSLPEWLLLADRYLRDPERLRSVRGMTMEDILTEGLIRSLQVPREAAEAELVFLGLAR